MLDLRSPSDDVVRTSSSRYVAITALMLTFADSLTAKLNIIPVPWDCVEMLRLEEIAPGTWQPILAVR